ncbi:MAG: hypothetical protein C5B51_07310 [Terriglobia bacterium]|nr:MAG: hypothetical protein C5B51_07310 [Terriglobia bacterium]
MATIEYWIQIENRAWDVCPHNIDRMWGQNLEHREGKDPVNVTLKAKVPPNFPATRNVTMYKPLRNDDDTIMEALILRRYVAPAPQGQLGLAAWSTPDDRKVNPWDANEPDPTNGGTMGTIPGPVIECSVGDKVIVHFRNMDSRQDSKGKDLPLESGSQVTFDFQADGHTVQFTSFTRASSIPNITGDGNPQHYQTSPVPVGTMKMVTVTKTQASGGQIKYQCGIHGASMSGTIKVT